MKSFNKMTYKEFLQLACFRPHPATKGFYKLEWFKHNEDDHYSQCEIPGGFLWEYRGLSVGDIGNFEYYPTFEGAHSAMSQKIGTENIDGFIIRKLGYGLLGTKDFYLHFTSYDAEGKEILHSVCSSYHYNQPGLAGKFLGRDDISAHFKLGEIVQIERSVRDSMWAKCTLGVVVGLPRSTFDFWNSYEEDVKELGRQEANEKWFDKPSMMGSDDDEYFIQFGPYEPDMLNFTFRNAVDIRLPALHVPKEVRDMLHEYHKGYIDYLNSGDD